jgi:hypothetical protein
MTANHPHTDQSRKRISPIRHSIAMPTTSPTARGLGGSRRRGGSGRSVTFGVAVRPRFEEPGAKERDAGADGVRTRRASRPERVAIRTPPPHDPIFSPRFFKPGARGCKPSPTRSEPTADDVQPAGNGWTSSSRRRDTGVMPEVGDAAVAGGARRLGDAGCPRFEEPGAKVGGGRGVHGAPEEARAAAAMGWRGGSWSIGMSGGLRRYLRRRNNSAPQLYSSLTAAFKLISSSDSDRRCEIPIKVAISINNLNKV